MSERCSAYPWSGSPLGEPGTWDSALKTLVPIVLTSNQPMFVTWGDQRTLIYNDAYGEILADKHPDALGRDFLEVWNEIRADLEPIVESAYSGTPVQMDDIELWMERRGYREETHFSFFYTPVRNEDGDIEGFFCACNEITAQILAERRLTQSEAHHRGVLENIDEGFSLFDKDFNILEVNRTALRLVGLTREEMIGKNHWELFPGTLDGAVGHLYRQVLDEQMPRSMQHCYSFGDGRDVWFEIRAFPVGDGLASVFRDITQTKRLQQEAEVSAARVQLAFDAARLGWWQFDPATGQVEHDQRYAEIYGLSGPSPRHVDDVSALIHPDDASRLWDAVNAAMSPVDPQPYAVEYRINRPDGKVRWLEARGMASFRGEGAARKVVDFVGTVADISDRRAAEEVLKQNEARFRSMADTSPAALWLTDPDGFCTFLSRRWYELTGQTEAEALGLGWVDATHPEDKQHAGELFLAANQARRLFQTEYRLRTADGTYRWAIDIGRPWYAEDGTYAGMVGVVFDIDDRKRAEQALEVASQRKDEFLAMLAHELRNPLAPISTSAQILKRTGADSSRTAHLADLIGRQVGHLTTIVDDLLDVSRVTRGLVSIERQAVDMRAVVAAAIEQAQSLIHARGHSLHTAVVAEAVTVDGDFHRLVQVVVNLLTNAAKYTPQNGRIDIRLTVAEGDVVVSVSDTGVGIPTALLPEVFDLFTQAERTPDRTQGGLGIGLALARSLVHLHGGTVTAASEGPNRGSTFAIRLPRSTSLPAGASAQVAADRMIGRHRILIVDDNKDAAETLAELLRMLGNEVAVAADGAEGLARAAEVPCDTFILDIGLPDMTGLELAQRLRAGPAHAGATYIALTGYGQAQDRVLSKAAGIDHHMVKPPDLDRLLAILELRAP